MGDQRDRRAEFLPGVEFLAHPPPVLGATVENFMPPDASIKADLAAPRWELTARGIKIEDKDEIRKRLGRSPDDGDAIVMCLSEGARAAARLLREQQRPPRPQRANVGYNELKKR